MKTKTVSYSKVFSLGNYGNEKIGDEIEIQGGYDVQKEMLLDGFLKRLKQTQ